MNPKITLDVGCGSSKKEGSIGIDHFALPGVDHILNIEADRFPLEDNSVDAVYSAHCLEHLSSPGNAWREISRVVKPGGTIEIWTPYPHHDDQWLNGHVSGWSESRWKHLCSQERAFYSDRFLGGGYWRWDEARFVISSTTAAELKSANISIEFAVRHMINIVEEWGCFFTYVTSDPGEHSPRRSYTNDRQGISDQGPKSTSPARRIWERLRKLS
jgi:SAM-dependent methyltransferase